MLSQPASQIATLNGPLSFPIDNERYIIIFPPKQAMFWLFWDTVLCCCVAHFRVLLEETFMYSVTQHSMGQSGSRTMVPWWENRFRAPFWKPRLLLFCYRSNNTRELMWLGLLKKTNSEWKGPKYSHQRVHRWPWYRHTQLCQAKHLPMLYSTKAKVY